MGKIKWYHIVLSIAAFFTAAETIFAPIQDVIAWQVERNKNINAIPGLQLALKDEVTFHQDLDELREELSMLRVELKDIESQSLKLDLAKQYVEDITKVLSRELDPYYFGRTMILFSNDSTAWCLHDKLLRPARQTNNPNL